MPRSYPEEKSLAAVTLFDNGFNYDQIARVLVVGRQTVRRWIVPGAREAHNEYIYATRPDPAASRCKMDATSGIDERIQKHRERILRGGECAAPTRREAMRAVD